MIAIVFLISTTLWLLDIISDQASLIITIILFITDYIAEMYDPNPDNPGPWFKRHFHRIYDNDDSDDYVKCEFTELVNRLDAESEEFFRKAKKD